MDHKFPRQGSSKYHTWFFTVRPRDGISQYRIDLLKSWIEKQSFWFCVTEGNGPTLHLHCCICFKNAKIRSNVINAVLMLKGMDFDHEEAAAFRSRNYKGRCNPCIWYNFDVVNEYLAKDSGCRIITQHLPPKSEWDFFQENWMPCPDDKRLEKGPNTNAEWRRIKKLYEEEDLPPGVKMPESWFIQFFLRLQREDKMRATPDMRILQQKVRWFKDVYLSDDPPPDHYLGSEAKRLKTVEEEEEIFDQQDRVRNPHLYTDSEDRAILDRYLTKK